MAAAKRGRRVHQNTSWPRRGGGGEEVRGASCVARRGGVPQSDLLGGHFGPRAEERYGGFMRRVGRPEWLVESSKSGGVCETGLENGSEIQKRYGGFMD
ncbi:hypothetical protein KUCAC02_018654 [Chaenocephalus aceratus]|uniref:Uncharacterized protein n=1 Tax=Chaenocephalus aceratus TaxID=36190 RepID=A0ACB9W9E2_CHAAC|nr:hypothetical protein KUCAC02_018654 [Chaenocephalus aceratus]